MHEVCANGTRASEKKLEALLSIDCPHAENRKAGVGDPLRSPRTETQAVMECKADSLNPNQTRPQLTICFTEIIYISSRPAL